MTKPTQIQPLETDINDNRLWGTHLFKTRVPIITVDKEYRSVYGYMVHRMTDTNGMFISDRQNALNFRHRASEVNYESDWHVAGDPTLIIIQQGQLELSLRNNSKRLFSVGDQFIAADYLPDGKKFSPIHGHKAKVISEQPLHALHIKLSDCPQRWLLENQVIYPNSQ